MSKSAKFRLRPREPLCASFSTQSVLWGLPKRRKRNFAVLLNSSGQILKTLARPVPFQEQKLLPGASSGAPRRTLWIEKDAQRGSRRALWEPLCVSFSTQNALRGAPERASGSLFVPLFRLKVSSGELPESSRELLEDSSGRQRHKKLHGASQRTLLSS